MFQHGKSLRFRVISKNSHLDVIRSSVNYILVLHRTFLPLIYMHLPQKISRKWEPPPPHHIRPTSKLLHFLTPNFSPRNGPVIVQHIFGFWKLSRKSLQFPLISPYFSSNLLFSNWLHLMGKAFKNVVTIEGMPSFF